jgi:hypothetical protein
MSSLRSTTCSKLKMFVVCAGAGSCQVAGLSESSPVVTTVSHQVKFQYGVFIRPDYHREIPNCRGTFGETFQKTGLCALLYYNCCRYHQPNIVNVSKVILMIYAMIFIMRRISL